MNTTLADDTFSAATALDQGASCGMAASFWGAPWSYPELFAPLQSGATGHLWWAGGNWNTFQDYGGAGMGLAHFSTVVWRDGRSEVFALGQDGAIWHDYWDTAKGDWSGWGSLGGSLSTGAAGIVWLDGHGELFAADASGVAWHNYSGAAFPSGWSGWNKIDGVAIASRPVPVRWDDGHVEIFARTSDGHLAHAFWDGKVWQPFAALSSVTIVGEPQAMENPSGSAAAGPEVFARDASGQVVHLWWDGTAYTDFTPLGTLTASSDPFGWIRGDGRGEVFAVDSEGALEHSLRDQGNWSQWSMLANGVQPCAPPLTVQSSDMGTGGGGDGGAPSADLGQGAMAAKGCSCALAARAGCGGPLGALLLCALALARSLRRRRRR
jgi:hypothetical protein